MRSANLAALYACPFCRSLNTRVRRDVYASASCADCGAQGPRWRDYERAISAWNEVAGVYFAAEGEYSAPAHPDARPE